MNLNESCAEITVSSSPLTPKKEEPVLNNENEASTSTSRSSPEPCCPICLGKLENKSFTDSCLHQFCFKCLLEWSKVKAECPLCKQSFKSIIHNVRSIEDYEQYYLTTSATEGTLYVSREIFARLESSQPSSYREPSNYRFRTSAVSSYLDYFVRLEEAISHRVIPPGPGVSGGVLWQRRRQRGTSDFRRNIYQQGLWVQRTSDVTGRVRECSPDFYRANPAQVHRLVPWLNRELNVLLYENSPHIQHVMSRILELITQVPIRSPGFASVIGPYIGRHTEHFIHEFHSFAISPFDLVGYDRHANYVGRSEIVDYDDVTRDSDSDVQVLDEAGHRPSSPLIQLVETDSDDCIVLDAPVRTEPEVITLDSDNDDDVVQISIQTSVRPVQSTTTAQCTEPGPSRRPRLRRNWLTVNNVAVPSTSQTSCEISISIEHSTRSVSPTVSETSSSSWTPTRPRRLHKVKKVRAAGRKGKATQATVKQRITSDSDDGDAATRRRAIACIPSSTSDDSDLDSAPARAPCTQRPSVSLCPSTSTVSRWSSDSSLSSSSEEEYKPRLRSVVVKSTVKPEPRAVSPMFRPHSPSPYSSPFSPQSYADIPSSSRSRHHRRHSTSSSADLNTPTKKCKHSRKRHKRDK